MESEQCNANMSYDNLTDFDVLAKLCYVNSKKYAVFLPDLMKEFDNMFQDRKTYHQFLGIFVTPFSVDMNIPPSHF